MAERLGKAAREFKALEELFAYQWAHPPAPFNPDFNPDWEKAALYVRQKIAENEPYPTRAARAEAYRVYHHEYERKHPKC